MGLWSKVRGLLGGGEPAPAPTPVPTPQELFLAEVEAVFRQIPSVTAVRRKPEDFALIVTRGGQDMTTFLGNVFSDSRDLSPEARAERVRRFAATLETPPASELDWEDARDHLIPVLRASTFFIGLPPGAQPPLHRAFAPFLIEAVAIDSDHAIQYATGSHVEKWGVDSETVFSTARDNAARFFDDRHIESYDPQAPYPLWHVANDDDYEASRLLKPGWLAAFRGRVTGRPVAIAPHRSMLIVGGDGDERCLARLVETARSEYQASSRRISPALYSVDDEDTVVPLVLPTSHPAANGIALARALLADREYGSQRTTLQASVGDTLFVASYVGLQRPDGSVTSYAAWTEGVPTLLPRADEIAFNPAMPAGAAAAFRVSWEQAERLAGSSIVAVPGLDPPRWRAEVWPDEQALGRLREVALP